MSEIGKFSGVTEGRIARSPELSAPGAGSRAVRQLIAIPGKESPQGATETDGSGLEETLIQLNERVQSISRELRFSVDPATGYQVVQVLDAKSGDVIRQMPSDQLLALAERILVDGELPRKGLLMEGVV